MQPTRLNHIYIDLLIKNLRTRIGCDLLVQSVAKLIFDFNPRTRIGCDLMVKGEGLSYADFNPRTRIGCDNSFAF